MFLDHQLVRLARNNKFQMQAFLGSYMRTAFLIGVNASSLLRLRILRTLTVSSVLIFISGDSKKTTLFVD